METLQQMYNYVVIYNDEKGSSPFFNQEDALADYFPWVLYCDVDETSENWKQWRRGWGEDSRRVFNDIKKYLSPSISRLVVFRTFNVKSYDNDISFFSNFSFSDDEENDENTENEDQSRLEQMIQRFATRLEDDSTSEYPRQKETNDVFVKGEYIFVKW